VTHILAGLAVDPIPERVDDWTGGSGPVPRRAARRAAGGRHNEDRILRRLDQIRAEEGIKAYSALL